MSDKTLSEQSEELTGHNGGSRRVGDEPKAETALALSAFSAVQSVKLLYNIMAELKQNVLKPGIDYGVIPNTGEKPTLLLPGMEKLCRALNVEPRFIDRQVIVDYDKPLFHYHYECQLVDIETGLVIPGGCGLGLCTSMESSFHWRQAKRVCPTCGKDVINKSKNKPEWYCWSKIGGCGATFREDDERITSQTVGRIENPDIFDQINAIMKRAKKRALGDAIKGAAAVSEFFTVDLEDFTPFALTHSGDDIVDAEFTEVLDNPTPPVPPKKKPSKTEAPTPDEPTVKYDLTAVVEGAAFMYDHPAHAANSIAKMVEVGEIEPGFSTNAAIAKVMLHRALSQPYAMPVQKVCEALTVAMEAEGSAVPIASVSQWVSSGKTIAQAWDAVKTYHENNGLKPAKAKKQAAQAELIPPSGHEIPYE